MKSILVPDSWGELTDYQQREIIHIISQTETEDFTEQYLKIVQVLLMKDDSPTAYFKMRKILREIPLSNFKEATKFLESPPNIYHFPKIKGLREPAHRLGDMTIKQFSICDTLLYRYNQKRESIYLRQLVACIYRFQNEDFDELKLKDIAEITDKIDLKEAQRIGFIFQAIRLYIGRTYPQIFKENKPPEDSDMPVFRKKEVFTPFSKVIVMMAADELRLLGNLHECQNTLVYDFFNAFLESKKIHQLKNKI